MKKVYSKLLMATLTLILQAFSAYGMESSIATFEDGSDGFYNIKVEQGTGKDSQASARLENTASKWATSLKTLELERELKTVKIWVKSNDIGRLSVRIADSTGQYFQPRVSFQPDGDWHEIVVNDFTSGEVFGGAKDRIIHHPVKKVELVLEGKGTIWFDNVSLTLSDSLLPEVKQFQKMLKEAKIDPRDLIYDLRVLPGTASNVFTEGDKVSLQVESKRENIEYTVRDYWNNIVEHKSLPVKDNKAIIHPPADNGYYLVSIKASEKGEEKIGETFTSYCVIPTVKITDRKNNPFAVMTHFAQRMPLEILPVLSKAGITMIRDEMYWGSVEKEKGVYTIPDYGNKFMAECAKYNIAPLIEMTFNNKLHDEGNAPYTKTGCEAYANYGAALVDKFSKQIKWLEIWNEYNGSWCKGPAANDRPKYYTQMLRESYEIIKRRHPQVKILGGAAVLIPLPFFRKMFEHGALAYMDAVVIHPYRKRPEGVEKEVAALRELIKKYNGGKDKPIWATETGLMERTEYEWEKGLKLYEKGRHNVAAYLVKQYSLLLSQNVEKVFWYLAADHGPFMTMGLLRHEEDTASRLTVAAPYVAYANMVNQLHDRKCLGREQFGPYTRSYVVRFRGENGRDVLVCWATYPSKINVSIEGKVEICDIMGRRKILDNITGSLMLELSSSPVYITGKVNNVFEIETAEKVIASTVDEYSKTQGDNGWQYGYYEVAHNTDNNHTGDFKPMQVVETMWGEIWKGPGKFLTLGASGGHPEITDGKELWPVRRWTSNYSGMAKISGKCSRDNTNGDGVNFIILQDGREISRSSIGGKSPLSINIERNIMLEKGNVIDFCITPNSNTNFDSTNFDMMIKTVAK